MQIEIPDGIARRLIAKQGACEALRQEWLRVAPSQKGDWKGTLRDLADAQQELAEAFEDAHRAVGWSPLIAAFITASDSFHLRGRENHLFADRR